MSSDLEKQMAMLKANYVEALPKKIEAIRVLWIETAATKNTDSLTELHRMAHSLVGSGATYDQIQVSECAKELENYIKDHAAANDIFEVTQEMDSRLRSLENAVNG